MPCIHKAFTPPHHTHTHTHTHTHLVPDVVSFPPNLWQFVFEGGEENGEELVEVRVPVVMATIIIYTQLTSNLQKM